MVEYLSFGASILTGILSIIALVISVKSWSKQRNIYFIERCLYDSNNPGGNMNKPLLNKLKSGNYTVLDVKEDAPYLAITIGKTK